ncbi:MAG: GDSL-type esterase/lipase family protein [Gallionella sp.]|nr:SGNH/GDSL hydrolase family protein [Gallionella sp.]
MFGTILPIAYLSLNRPQSAEPCLGDYMVEPIKLLTSLRFLVVCGVIIFAAGCSNLSIKQTPKVLVIGDSISIGYTPFISESLKNVSVVSHIEGNAKDSDNGVIKLHEWIGNATWNIIVFNFGLWDICYRNFKPFSEDNRDKVNGIQAVPIDRYRSNLELITAKLKTTGAKLIYINTTVVPPDEPGRFTDDVEKYNDIAEQLMQREGIKVVNLQKLSSSFMGGYNKASRDVHYTPEGYQSLAAPVTQAIRSELP